MHADHETLMPEADISDCSDLSVFGHDSQDV